MIVVTGATGLVGSHLLYRILAGGGDEAVRIVVRDISRLEGLRRVFSFYGKDWEAYSDRVEVIEGDLFDLAVVEDMLEGVDKVYHCASVVSFDPRDRTHLIEGNKEITANLVNSMLYKGVRRMLHVSSTSALGEALPGDMVTEELEWEYSRSRTGYSVSKFESEREVWRGWAEGLEVVIVNPAMVVGPGNWGESSTGLISRCDEGLLFFTEGVNAYVDVRDVAEVMVRLMESDINGERFVLAAENITFREFFGMVCHALGRRAPRYRARRWMAEVVWRMEYLRSLITSRPPVITHETARTAMKKTFYSSEKAEKTLGFSFRPLHESIGWTCRHYLREKSSDHSPS
jgi:dihydroflavonol-4-reductase